MRYIIRTSEVMADTVDAVGLDNKIKVAFHEVIDLKTNEIKIGTFDYGYASEKLTYLENLEVLTIDSSELSPQVQGALQISKYQ